jgi:putative colanic acid biosynthesis acetyltransferase WcaF
MALAWRPFSTQKRMRDHLEDLQPPQEHWDAAALLDDDLGPVQSVDRPQVDLATYQKNHRLTELLRRALWECLQLPFMPLRPRGLSRVRVALLRAFGAKIGKNVLICGGVRVHVPWHLELGDYVAVGDKVEIYNLAPVRIGAHAVVSQRAYLCSSSHDYTRTNFPLYSLPITIGPQAWIAAGSFIAPGITIGEGSVIGANSVVTKDIPEWTVAAGNPCRLLKPRVLRQRDLQPGEQPR